MHKAMRKQARPKRLQQLVLLFCLVGPLFLVSCGGNDMCDPDRPQEKWFGLDGSELAPWSVRLKHSYDGKDPPEWCSSGLFDGGIKPQAFKTPSNGIILLGDMVARYESGTWNKISRDQQTIRGQRESVVRGCYAVGSQGRVVLWWTAADGRTHLSELAGNEWRLLLEETTGISPPDCHATTLDNLDRMLVVWRNYTESRNDVYLSRLEGQEWKELGGSASGMGVSDTASGSADWPTVITDSNSVPYVVWREYVNSENRSVIYLRRYNGGSWNEVAGSASGTGLSGTGGSANRAILVIDSRNRPVVGWTQYSNEGEPVGVVKRFENGIWTEIVGSNGLGALKSTPTFLKNAAFAVDRDDNPVFAWPNDDEIYLTRFDGTDWVELNGSASGYGISNSENVSKDPSVVATEDMICVAWSENKPDYWDPADEYSQLGRAVVLMRCSYY